MTDDKSSAELTITDAVTADGIAAACKLALDDVSNRLVQGQGIYRRAGSDDTGHGPYTITRLAIEPIKETAGVAGR